MNGRPIDFVADSLAAPHGFRLPERLAQFLESFFVHVL